MCGLQVLAEDLDSQVNGRITYSILKGDRTNHFWIDPVAGLLKVNKRLDRELVRRIYKCNMSSTINSHFMVHERSRDTNILKVSTQ